MTREGYEALKAELAELEGPARREIADRIKTAREWGDLKENSEYHDAKNDQAHLETKILRIREQLLAAEVREVETQTDTVGFGSKVEVEDADSGKRTSYTLVSAPEANPAEGKLSIDSPVGRALVGARVGDERTMETPRTYIRDGEVREIRFDIRYFLPEELREWLLAAGFERVELLGAAGEPFSLDSRRLVALARAPS